MFQNALLRRDLRMRNRSPRSPSHAVSPSSRHCQRLGSRSKLRRKSVLRLKAKITWAGMPEGRDAAGIPSL